MLCLRRSQTQLVFLSAESARPSFQASGNNGLRLFVTGCSSFSKYILIECEILRFTIGHNLTTKNSHDSQNTATHFSLYTSACGSKINGVDSRTTCFRLHVNIAHARILDSRCNIVRDAFCHGGVPGMTMSGNVA